MRHWVVLTAALFLIPIPAGAQEGGQGDGSGQVLEDDSGDVAYESAAGTPVPASEEAKAADLVAAHVEETAQDFTFSIAFAQAPQNVLVDHTRVFLYFTAHDVPLYVEYDIWPDPSGVYGYASLVEDAEEGWDDTREWEEIVVTDETVSATFPRSALYDSKGANPFPGRAFTDFWAVAYGVTEDLDLWLIGDDPIEFPVVAQDRMPDEGVGTVSWPIQYGLEQSGHIHLDSWDPIRTSNGEAATFIFHFNVRNDGEEPDFVSFEATGVPQGWQVTFPRPSMMVQPFDEDEHEGWGRPGGISVPVVVTTPFGHDHGKLATFIVEAMSKRDPSAVGRAELGIRYTAIPQPAGHHPTMYIHSDPWQLLDHPELGQAWREIETWGSGLMTMNTLDDYELDQGVDIHGYKESTVPNGLFRWGIYLDPSLAMGLDFDLEGTGEIVTTIRTVAPLQDAVASGKLYHFDWCWGEVPWEMGDEEQHDGRTLLGTFQATDPADLDAQAEEPYTLTFTPNEEADYIRYQQGACLAAMFQVETTTPASFFGAADAPYMKTGGTITLPLNEYSDKIEDVVAGTEVSLIPVGDQERMLNPGATALYQVKILNGLPEEGTYKLNVYGSNVEWASLPEGGTVRLDGTEEAVFPVVVRAPGDAGDDERADLIVEAVHQEDPDLRSLLRLLTVVDTEADHPDDAASAEGLGPKGKDTPGLLLPVLAGVLALAVMMRRRDQ